MMKNIEELEFFEIKNRSIVFLGSIFIEFCLSFAYTPKDWRTISYKWERLFFKMVY